MDNNPDWLDLAASGRELLKAIEKRDIAGVEAQLAAGAAPNAADRMGRTALFYALGSAFKAATVTLLDAGANAKHADKLGGTALHHAAGGPRAVIELLHLKGAEIEAADAVDGLHPLHRAAGAAARAASMGDPSWREDSFYALLDLGADINAGGTHGETPLHLLAAMAPGKVTAAVAAAAPAAAAPTAAELAYRRRALWGAALRPERGANLAAADTDGTTPLHVASDCGNLEAVEALLSRGASPSVRTAAGFTPLHVAAIKGHAAIVERLLQAVLDEGDQKTFLEAYASSGQGALHFAAAGGHVEVIRTLLQHGADPTLTDFGSLPPRHYALKGNHAEAEKLLLDKIIAQNLDPEHGMPRRRRRLQPMWEAVRGINLLMLLVLVVMLAIEVLELEEVDPKAVKVLKITTAVLAILIHFIQYYPTKEKRD